MSKDKKVAFRLNTEQYYSIYRIYESYLKYSPTLTFSNFLRNLILSITASVEAQQKDNEIKQNG